jgi:hypothetical protein
LVGASLILIGLSIRYIKPTSNGNMP